MKKFIYPLLILMITASCTVITTEPYRSADTLGGPLHFRAGIGAQLGGLISGQTRTDTLENIGIVYPAGIAYAGIGLWKNLDLYASVSMTFPAVGTSFSLKYKFYDKLGFKAGMMPTFKYSTGAGEAVGDSFSYRLIGGELPVMGTFSLADILKLTVGVQGGYYRYMYDSGTARNYDFFSYGLNLMPELKLFFFRITPGVEFRGYYSMNTPIVYNSDYNLFQKHVFPYLSISFQF